MQAFDNLFLFARSDARLSKNAVNMVDASLAENWWGTLNKMSRAEVYFQHSIKQRDPRRGRAMLVKRSSRAVEICATPGSLLRHHWLKITEDGLDMGQSGSSDLCIVLEDLSREWVEILGVLLSIPVSVFASHWANPIDHVAGDIRVPIGESPARHFILNYRQSLPFSILNRKHQVTINGVKKGRPRIFFCFKAKVFFGD